MGIARYLGKGVKLYFWVLVTAAVGAIAWLAVRVAGGVVGDTIGWAAFVGIVGVIVVLLAAIRRAVRMTARGV